MPSPLSNFDGNGNLRVDASAATGARTFPEVNQTFKTFIDLVEVGDPGDREITVTSTTDQSFNVALGKPVLEGLRDICAYYQIPVSQLTDANGRYQYGIVGPDSSVLDLSLTWTQQGVQQGDRIQLTDV